MVADIAPTAKFQVFTEFREQAFPKTGIARGEDARDASLFSPVEENESPAFFAISSCSSALLQVGEGIGGQLAVDDGSDIAFIDTHAEGIG